MQPLTSDVLQAVAQHGVVVGSFPKLRELAKDIDVVVRPRKLEQRRNPCFEAVVDRYGEHTRSAGPGHLWIEAVPQPVELFEDSGFSPDDPDKQAAMLTYRQAARRASLQRAYGMLVRMVD